MKKFLLLFALVTFTMLSFTETSANSFTMEKSGDEYAQIPIDVVLSTNIEIMGYSTLVDDQFVLLSMQNCEFLQLTDTLSKKEQTQSIYRFRYRGNLISSNNVNFERKGYALKPPQNTFDSNTNSKLKLNYLSLRVRGKPFILVKNYNT